MDVDPYADSVPPRYAIESDEEEDELNPLTKATSPPNAEVSIVGDVSSGSSVIFATGAAAKYWARGVGLGEQTGTVTVNKIQVGLVFRPPWTKSTVITSEVTTRLPLWAIYAYVQAILGAFKPPSVSLLDVYAVHTYISSEPVSFLNAPVRYLSTQNELGDVFKSKSAQLFAPPNLIQGVSAAFLSLLAAVSPSRGSLVLLSSPHIQPPAPKTLQPSDFSHISEDEYEWPSDTMNDVTDLLLLSVGEMDNHRWEYRGSGEKPRAGRRRGDVGDGGMYI